MTSDMACSCPPRVQGEVTRNSKTDWPRVKRRLSPASDTADGEGKVRNVVPPRRRCAVAGAVSASPGCAPSNGPPADRGASVDPLRAVRGAGTRRQLGPPLACSQLNRRSGSCSASRNPIRRRSEPQHVLPPIACIPRSRHDPKILWVDDAEIVGDRITKVRPIPRNLFTQKTERRIGELGASCVALVVSDVSVHEAP